MATGSSVGGGIGTIAGSALGPLGAAAGGFLGGIVGGLFDSDRPDYQYQNFIDPGVSQGIRDLFTNHAGAQEASIQGSRFMREGRNQYESTASQYAGNPSVQASLYDKFISSAEQNSAEAGVRGAQADTQTKAQGIQLFNQAENYNLNRNQFEYGKYQDQGMPTFTDLAAGNMQMASFGQTLSNPSGNQKLFDIFGKWFGGGNNPGASGNQMYGPPDPGEFYRAGTGASGPT
jgi:hypothetical protein